MSVYLRQARMSDLNDLLKLAGQFALLNLPANKGELQQILEISEKSFAGELEKDKAQYLFVAEDSEVGRVIATSKIVAKHGTPDNPNLFYKIEKKEKFSSDLGLGFIHQLLSFQQDYDGQTELGGLIVDQGYRRRPEKIGKTISLVRFMFIAAYKELFEDDLHCELAPPLTAEGRSEFWEALGRRFTGLPYEEADRLSRTNKEFIKSLFPEDKIYMTLLESSARLVVGEVGVETRPARALMEKLGFVYKDEIDPFDGGPHLGVSVENAEPVKAFKKFKLCVKEKLSSQNKMFLVGGVSNEGFKARLCFPEITEDKLCISEESNKILGFISGQEVFMIPIEY